MNPELIDTQGRVVRDLRISVTDRCNLRCVYCMPAEGMPWLSKDLILSYEEIARVSRIALGLGVTGIRLTGGEPTVRADLPVLVKMLSDLRPGLDLSLTTNALKLAAMAEDLRAAGLTRVNVSLDTLDRERFHRIARRDRLADVLAGLAAAHRAGLQPVKVNAVLDPTTGLEDAVSLLRFSLEHDYRLRIIEQMPLDAGHEWSRGTTIGADEVLATLQRHFTLTPDPAPRGSAPAQLWLVNGGPATVGIIASVSDAFCSACDRTRLTADGQVRSCLFSREETDLRALMRTGADDAALEAAWRAAMWAKPAGHGINDPDFVQPDRPMSAIGG